MRDLACVRAKTLLAKKAVKRGDIILTSKPFCTLLDSSLIGCYCEYCFGSARKDRILRRCRDCGRAWYCSDLCRELSQPQHQRECAVFRSLPHFTPSDYARFLARLIHKLRDGGEEIVEKIDEKRSRRFRDLESHYREVRESEEHRSYVESLLPDLRVLLSPDSLPQPRHLLTIYGKVRISYLDAMDSRQHRQSYLYQHYFFSCDCRLCRDDARERLTSTVTCGSSVCDAAVYLDETADGGVDPCQACGCTSFRDDLRQEYRRLAALTRTHLMNLNEENPELEVWREVVASQEEVFHPLNVLRAKAVDALLTATVNCRGWHSALALAKLNHSAIRHYYGASHPTYGLFLLKLAKIELCNMAFSSALQHLQEAEKILEAGLGSNHPLVYNDLMWLLVQASEETRVQIQRSLMFGERGVQHPDQELRHDQTHHSTNRARS
ncbi:histone-lysine N-methyltransferase SMYD3-like isoform X2 [Cherax quadricarinatus]|uniref:histone-lysine N-methyltransferase SMYD3-like isoform X2 n=1 Tax=Cherax quadricarinatus TaxID=27406 RepID=UPI00387E5A3F